MTYKGKTGRFWEDKNCTLTHFCLKNVAMYSFAGHASLPLMLSRTVKVRQRPPFHCLQTVSVKAHSVGLLQKPRYLTVWVSQCQLLST